MARQAGPYTGHQCSQVISGQLSTASALTPQHLTNTRLLSAADASQITDTSKLLRQGGAVALE